MRDHGTLGEFSRSVDELATVAQQRTGRLELLSLDEATEAVVIKQRPLRFVLDTNRTQSCSR